MASGRGFRPAGESDEDDFSEDETFMFDTKPKKYTNGPSASFGVKSNTYQNKTVVK